MRNKKGLIFKNVFFALVVVSVFVLAIGDTISRWSDAYGSGISYDLGTYSNLESSKQTAESYGGKVTPEDVDPGTGDFEGKLFRGGYGVIGDIITMRPIRGVYTMIEDFENRFSLPSYISEGIIIMMVFAFVFTGLAVIFRLTRSTA